MSQNKWLKVYNIKAIPPLILEHIINPALVEMQKDLNGRMISHPMTKAQQFEFEYLIEGLSHRLLAGTIYKFKLGEQDFSRSYELTLDLYEMVPDYPFYWRDHIVIEDNHTHENCD